jgi:hypothetical protein
MKLAPSNGRPAVSRHASHRRIRDELQTNSSIFSDFRWIAAFEPRLSKSPAGRLQSQKRAVDFHPFGVR